MIQLIGEITTSPKTSMHGLNHGHYKQEEKESIVKIIKDEKERTAHHDCGGVSVWNYHLLYEQNLKWAKFTLTPKQCYFNQNARSSSTHQCLKSSNSREYI